MAVSTDEKWSIDRLDGKNWMTWRFQIRHLLLAKDFWGFVDGTETLANDATAEQEAAFRKKSQKALSTIVMAVSPSQLYLITSCDTPQQAWESLRNHFERDTLANKLLLKKKYFRMEMKETASAEAHLKDMKELTDKLAAVGAPIAEEDQVVTLLGSLPKKYSTLVRALEARRDDLSLSYVQEALLHEEQKLSDSPELSQGDPKALVGQQRPVRCYACGEIGHIRRFCPVLRRGRHKASPANQDAEETVVAFAASAKLRNGPRWLVDSGASSHMTRDRKLLVDYKKFDVPQKVRLGDGRTVDALGAGNVHVRMLFRVSESKMNIMYGVLYVPELTCNLFSVRAAAAKGNTVNFGSTKCWIRDRQGGLRGMGALKDRVYELDCMPVVQELEWASVVSECEKSADLWHQRLGHLCEQQLKEMVSKEMVGGMKLSQSSQLLFCEGCVEGKLKRKPFQPVGEIRSTRRLERVHSDVCGPMATASIGGSKYFVTFIDDYSRCTAVYFLKQKNEVFEKFQEFEKLVTNETGTAIGALRSDNGGEYVSSKFESYLKSRGIRHELTVPHTPQQNGVAERMNRTLMESARSMMAHARLPNCFWAEAVSTAAYLRNRMVTTAFEKLSTPYERWYGVKPNISHLRVFGCVAYAHVPDGGRTKLDKKSEKLRFVGYCSQSKGYRLWNEKTRNVVVRREVVFNEIDFGQLNSDVQREPPVSVIDLHNDHPVIQEPVETPAPQDDHPVIQEPAETPAPQGDSPSLERPHRPRHQPVRYGIDEYVSMAILAEDEVIDTSLEPSSLTEALSSIHAREWKAAADAEYQSLVENGTWELVELPVGRTPIKCKWVFKIKRGSDGSVDRFKGRLVAKGYAQQYGVDYDETYSPVVRFSSVRVLLAFAMDNDLLVHQMDVVSAFLNGTLEEEIYMEQPEGYMQPGTETLVCKLKRSLYGLKQSPRCWNTTLTGYLEGIGLCRNAADPCVFVQLVDGVPTIIAVYVDDLILLTKTLEEMNAIKQALSERFRMTDLGKIHYILGMTIEWDADGKWLIIHQKQYVLDVVEKYRLSEANTVATPADVHVQLKKDDGCSKLVDATRYQSMVGSLLYMAVATRPDIAQAVGAVAKFCSRPSEAHLTAVKRILRYLKGTANLGLKFMKSESGELTGYSDADWAGDVDERRSTTGNLFLMSGAPVSWLSKKQTVVALSTSEAEYVALSMAAQEAVWLRRFLSDLTTTELGIPTIIMEDNQGAIAMARNPGSHARTKHIDIRFHYVREAVQQGAIALQYCPTDVMLADLLTKSLAKSRFESLRSAMGVAASRLSGSVEEQ